MTEDIDAGLSFSQAMARQGKIFPDYYIEMVRAAEVTGNLNEVASFLADYTEKEGDLASKAASALVYPGIVVGLFIVVAFILITFVYPSLGAVFAENGVALPWYTQVLLNTGNFLHAMVDRGDHRRRRARRGRHQLFPDGRRRGAARRGEDPPADREESVSARHHGAVRQLGGAPRARRHSDRAGARDHRPHGGQRLYRDVVHDIAEDVRQGSLLSASIAKHPEFFPPLVSQMVAVGETTGKIEEMFTRLSGIYTREADEVTNNLVDLIQPVLMIGIGLMVGLLFASILIPIYSLTESIH